MPYWSREEENALRTMVEQGKPIEEICKVFHRSLEAIRLKIRRLGLEPPVSRKTASDKVTTASTTTTRPIKMAKDLISPEEALKMWLGCVKRLNEPGCTPQDVKRIRLILTALKGYIIVCSDYYERIRTVELKMEQLKESMVKYYKRQYEMAQTEEEKAKWQRQIDELEVEPEAREELKAKKYHVWPRIARRRE